MDAEGTLASVWLLGGHGLYAGSPEDGWHRVGEYGYTVNAILRAGRTTIAAAGNGLWRVDGPDSRWVQLNDETLTEVSDIARAGDETGLIAAFAYGVATAGVDAIGSLRWTCLTGHLPVNRRHTNVLRVDPSEERRWIAGTEDGVIVGMGAGSDWVASDLTGTAVRGLCHARGVWWAGTDTRGVWRSDDGAAWFPAGDWPDAAAAFCVTTADDRILVGSDRGVYAGDGTGAWKRSGPRVRVRALCASPVESDTWLAGADPGGLWVTRNAGDSWRAVAGFSAVRAIAAPEEGTE